MIHYLDIIENIHNVINTKYCPTNRLNETVFTLKWLIAQQNIRILVEKNCSGKKHVWQNYECGEFVQFCTENIEMIN